MIITIDGPAGSGKSTVAESLAKELGYVHFNSGSLYRAITAFLIKENVDIEKLNDLKLPKIKLKVKFMGGVQHVFVNNVDYTSLLRENVVSINTPKVSNFPKIRKIVDDTQRNFAKKNNIVADGRDLGSFVFPNAEFKFYLDCDAKIRAKRRYAELNDSSLSLEDIEKQILARDEFDKNKIVAPLVVPKNAIIIDSSFLNVEQVVKLMIKHIKK